MKGKRLWYTFRLYTILTGSGRADYLRKHHVYGAIGERCNFQDRKVPLFPNLIKMGDHVRISSNVVFLTHDMVHMILNTWKGSNDIKENAGCIKIGNNVFIGAGVIIHPNVEIGNNVIIGAGSVVTQDIPSDSVVEGNPATILCKLSMLYAMRKMRKPYPDGISLRDGEFANEKVAEYLWGIFDKKHSVNVESEK